MVSKGLKFIFVAMVVWVGVAAICFGNNSGERVLRFPEKKSLGMIYLQDEGALREIKSFHHWIHGAEWEYFCNAQGIVMVPAGKIVRLTVAWKALVNLSGLSNLAPDDLYALSLPGTYKSYGLRGAQDRHMKYIEGLTGLKELDLGMAEIGSVGLKYIAGMKSLEWLTLSTYADDSSMEIVLGLTSLKELYFKGGQVTDEGLKHLEELKNLEQLAVSMGKVSNDGLRHVAKCGKVHYLMLGGRGLTDSCLLNLKPMKSLKILNLMGMSHFTDVGMKYLRELETVERVTLSKNENITDEGAKYLAKMKSLRMLNIRSSKVTDKGLGYLKENKLMEALDLPQKGITNKGLEHLSEMENLKVLSLPRPRYVRPQMDKKEYTDEGIAKLEKLTKLEDLSIGGLGVTDAGMDSIGRMKGLKRLMLFGCPITDNGLAKLKGLKDLEYLYLYESDVTISGLSHLNALSNLTELYARGITQDGSGLDILGLTKLEKLTIGTDKESGAIRDEDLACLAGIKSLEWFQISSGLPRVISDKGLAHLAGLENLDRLTIGGANITDEGLTYLSNLKKMNLLKIIYADITDRGLRHLAPIKSLAYLTIVSANDISPKAQQALRRELPNLFRMDIQRGRIINGRLKYGRELEEIERKNKTSRR